MAKTEAEIALMPALLTPKEAAEILGLAPSTVYDLASRGAIPRAKIGRAVRIPKAKLLEALCIESRKI